MLIFSKSYYVHILLVLFLFKLRLIYSHKNEIKLGILIPWSSKTVSGIKVAGAITRAIDDINSDTTLLTNTSITFEHRDSDCNEVTAVGVSVDLYNSNIDAFIGPPCSLPCTSVGKISSSKKIPMISYGCSSIELSDKKTYPYFSRTKAFARTSDTWTPRAFVKLSERYNWKTVCLIGRVHDIYTPLVDATVAEFQRNNITIRRREAYYTEQTDFYGFKQILARLKDDCRVIFIITRSADTYQFLLQAYRLEMTTNYALITIDFYYREAWNWEGKDTTYEEFKQTALNGLLTVSVANPDIDESPFKEFADDVRERVKQPPFNRTDVNNETEILNNAGYLYDAIVLYAKAVDEMWKNKPNASLQDAEEVFKYLVNVSFDGITGKVQLDAIGNRIPKFNVINFYKGESSVIGTFDALSANGSLELNSKTVWFPGKTTVPPLDVPKCGFDGLLCVEENNEFSFIPIIVAVPIIVTICMFVIVYLYNKKKYEMSILCKGLIINLKDLSFGGENSSFKSKISAMSTLSQLSRRNSGIRDIYKAGHHFPSGTSQVVIYRSEKIFLKTVKQTKVELNRNVLIHLKQMKDINHSNVNKFMGVVSNGPDLYLLWSFCSKGSLQDVLQNDDIECDWMFRLSFANDIAKGLQEIHRSPLGKHGNLSSANCLVDNRWVCKLSNFGTEILIPGIKNQPENTYHECTKRLWWSPERLLNRDAPSTKESDIYAYSIIMYEICTRGDPYGVEMEESDIQPLDVLQLVKCYTKPSYRPKLSEEDENAAPDEYVQLMQACWQDNPYIRPTVKEITRKILKLNKDYALGGSLVDHMLLMMEKYTNNLEDIVADRTRQLEEEKLKTETLLYKMLPRSVANKLKEGQPVLAEHFDAVTIFFSDIVGFTAICSESTPIEVVEMLNDLYSCFDTIVDSYDVYKVETIGDAYMVVSGLPLRNGDKHAGEIATMSLDLLSVVRTFKIKHKPGKQMQLRVGLHSGPAVAGVVGLKMPRYCLFGDTVNYASRMESSGLALRVHVSPESKAVLETLNGYHLTERGPVQMKGKGTVITYWLTGKDGFTKQLPDTSLAAGMEEHTFK